MPGIACRCWIRLAAALLVIVLLSAPGQAIADDAIPKPEATPVPTATTEPTEDPTATRTPESSTTPTPEPSPAPEPARLVAAWQLVDMQPGVEGIQTGRLGAPDQHDDDMLVSGLQIAPNLDDVPERRRVAFWLVATVPEGQAEQGEARLTITTPDGRVWAEPAATPVGCLALGALASEGSVLEAALHTGQLSTAEAEGLDGCGLSDGVVWQAEGALSAMDLAGTYQVEATLTNAAGTSDSRVIAFDVLPVIVVKDVDPSPIPTTEPTPPAEVTWTPAPIATPTMEATATQVPMPELSATAAAEPTVTVMVTGTSTPEVTASPTLEPTTTAMASVTASPEPSTSPTPGSTPTPPAPLVAAWQLVDMQPDTQGVQTGTLEAPDQHDDDMLALGLQVAPNLDDLPERREISYWLVVDVPPGSVEPTEVRVSISAPDGSARDVLAATLVSCVVLGDLASEGSVLEAAVHTSQLSPATARMLDGCGLESSLIWQAQGDLSVTDPPGRYEVEWSLVDTNGAGESAATSFDNLPVVGLALNFDRVGFGIVQPGSWQEAAPGAAADASGAAGFVARNTGNVPGYLTIEFGEMIGSSTGVAIGEFGAMLGSEVLSSIAPDVTACFSEPIAPYELRELRLLLHAGTIPVDSYRGSLSLVLTTGCPP